MDNVIAISGVGKEWDSTKKSQLSRYFRGNQKYQTKVEEDSLIGLSSVLFPYGEVGDHILYLMQALNDTDIPVEKALERLKLLVSSVKVFDYIEIARSVALKVVSKKSIKQFLAVNTLILSSYNYGRLEGSDTTKREVYFSNKTDVIDIFILLDLEVLRRKVPFMSIPNFLPMTSAEQKSFKQIFKKGEFAEVRKFYSSMALHDLERCYRRVCRGREEYYVSLLFHEVVNGVLPTAELFNLNDKLSRIMLKGESINDYRLEYLLKISILSNLEMSSFTKRKFLINPEGVTLHLKSTKFISIEKITVKEVHIEYPYEQHYLACTYVTNSGFSKTIPLHLDNLQLSIKMISVKEDGEAIILLAKWFGLLDKIEFKKDIELVEDLGYDTEEKQSQIFSAIQELFDLVVKELDVVVSDGKYTCSYPSDEETIIKEDELITKLTELIPDESVSYIDKLLAREHCMHLPEGFKLSKKVNTLSEVVI